MADISALTKTTSSTSNTSSTKSSSNTLGQEDFLTLLVAQLQNQDPLNPSDATEFTAQLAQYSQLEQLFNLNDSMDQLAAAQNNSQRISALSLIGKEVLVEGSEFAYSGDPVEIGYSIDGTVTDVDAIIQDKDGNTITTLSGTDTSKGNHTLTWNGKDASGDDVEAGTYTLVIKAKIDGDPTSTTVKSLIKTEVTGVDLNGSEPLLITVSGNYTIDEVYGAYDRSKSSADSEESEEDDATDTTTTEETVSAAKDGAGIIEDVVDALEEG
ncbi:flagellar hook assembly protein FlgD [Desulfogranum japonicum]|uniref:flagellar hook assembly protein FlgD n=1 Tax=Desulfogranum japonicum TaxID=231447 RepID=UPI00040F0841|nr:flagellar hook capping FlgD N-terminal domain-containing protein [Desulfogranum japonicum]